MPAKMIDDADTLRVTQEGKWDMVGGPDSYNGTLSSTMHVGNSLTVNFTGAYIVVYGRIDTASEGAVANFSIDGAPPAQVTMPAFVGDVPLLRQQLWIKKGLAPVDHTLRVTMARVRSGPIGFDYFQVDNSDTSIPTLKQWNLTGWPQPPPTPSGSSSQLPAGGIVGIVMACLCLLLGAAILLTWKRMRATTHPDEKRNSGVMRSLIDPFSFSQRTPDDTMDSSQIARASAAEHPGFDPTLFVRGPPAHGSHKFAVTTQPHDSRPQTARSRSGSIGASSSGAVSSPHSIPPGARPPTLIIPGSERSLDLRRRAGGGTTVVSDEEEDNMTSPPSPQQHVDSGVREPEVILAHSSRNRVELPPKYSAT